MTITMEESVKIAVDNGVKTLDWFWGGPDWRMEINPETLRLESGTHCVLGQIFGDFWEGVRTLNDFTSADDDPLHQTILWGPAFEFAGTNGFDAWPVEHDEDEEMLFDLLDAEWLSRLESV